MMPTEKCLRKVDDEDNLNKVHTVLSHFVQFCGVSKSFNIYSCFQVTKLSKLFCLYFLSSCPNAVVRFAAVPK